MGAHDDNETSAAEYFTLYAEIALSEVRDPVTGFDAAGLAALVEAAERFAREVRAIAGRARDGVCQTCEAPLWRKGDTATTCEACQGAIASDVSPLPTVAQWATS